MRIVLPLKRVLLIAASVWVAASAHAQEKDSTEHDMAGMDMSSGAPAKMSMNSALGGYAMTRDGSGTSWQPEATPMGGLHLLENGWRLMAHGYLNAVADDQSGPRGDSRTFTQSMFMLMAQRALDAGVVGLHAMLSLDPTQGARGYPLLAQTGETADGETALRDRQHPHDFFMELAGTFSLPLGENGSAFVYAGLPGEPALGPPAFMHRFSGMRNPEAPIGHHWFDSTHITFGVLTLGASRGAWKLETSWFNGREPDEHRWNIETRPFDSWAGRISFNPGSHWALQVSTGRLKSPEELEPLTRVLRTTASASYQASFPRTNWQTTVGYAVNDKRDAAASPSLPAWLLESTAVIDGTHTVFGRYEKVRNDELIAASPAHTAAAFTINKWTVGYIYDVGTWGPIRIGVGALIGLYELPGGLDSDYGSQPQSRMLFLQARL